MKWVRDYRVFKSHDITSGRMVECLHTNTQTLNIAKMYQHISIHF